MRVKFRQCNEKEEGKGVHRHYFALVALNNCMIWFIVTFFVILEEKNSVILSQLNQLCFCINIRGMRTKKQFEIRQIFYTKRDVFEKMGSTDHNHMKSRLCTRNTSTSRSNSSCCYCCYYHRVRCMQCNKIVRFVTNI